MAKGNRVLSSLLPNLWRVLGSTRLAAILLALLLLTSLLASLLPQMPANPAAREPWLAAVEQRYRTATGLIGTLGLFDTYRAPWFLALLAALLLNTFLCTIRRLPRLWKSLIQRPLITRPDAFYLGLAHRAEWPVDSLEIGLSTAQQTLQRHRYRTYLEREQAAGRAYLYGERGRWTQAGTAVSHLALLLLVTALLARPALAWQQSSVILFPGQTHPLDQAPALAVQAGPLTIDHHPGGQPRQYQVPLTVLVDGAFSTTQTVGLNHPLTVRGIAFHLQSYGPAAQLATPEGSFDLAFTGSQAQEINLPRAGITLHVVYQPAGGHPDDAEGGFADDVERGAIFVEATAAGGDLLGSGVVPTGREIVIQETPLTFTLINYTVWQISQDPTFGLAVSTAACLLAGMMISLWLPHRRLWLRVDGQTMRLVDPAGATDFDFLTHEIGEALTAEIDAASSDENAAACQPEGETDDQ